MPWIHAMPATMVITNEEADQSNSIVIEFSYDAYELPKLQMKFIGHGTEWMFSYTLIIDAFLRPNMPQGIGDVIVTYTHVDDVNDTDMERQPFAPRYTRLEIGLRSPDGMAAVYTEDQKLIAELRSFLNKAERLDRTQVNAIAIGNVIPRSRIIDFELNEILKKGI